MPAFRVVNDNKTKTFSSQNISNNIEFSTNLRNNKTLTPLNKHRNIKNAAGFLKVGNVNDTKMNTIILLKNSRGI